MKPIRLLKPACAFLIFAVLFTASRLCTLAADAGSGAAGSIWDHDNLHAWCVVPFDAKHRDSEERAAMLEQLGFKHFVYDWRPSNIPTFDAEIDALQKHHIDLLAWWSPTSANDPEALAILELFKRHNVHPQLWVFGGGPYTHSPQEQATRVQQESDRIEGMVKLAQPYGVSIELYSHNGWFGNEDNQIAIIEELKKRGITGVGMVYNFSHATDQDHDDTVNFPELWKRMQPYVVAVNLTGIGPGMKDDYLTRGTHEMDMMRTIQDSGWKGPIGLIAERGGDAEVTLGNYMKGLDWIAAELKQPGSGGEKPMFSNAPPAAASAPAAVPGENSAPGHAKAATDVSGGGISMNNRDELRTFPLTVEMWARLHDASGFNILIASDPKSSSKHWEIYSLPGSGALSVYLPGRNATISSTANVADDKWHYIAVTFDTSAVKMYVEGKSVDEASYGGETGSPDPGSIDVGQVLDGSLTCNGLIQDVRISKGVRDVSSVPAKPFTKDQQTLELWPLDGGAAGATAARVDTATTNAEAEEKIAAENFNITASDYFAPRDSLPQYKTIPAATPDELTPSNGWPDPATFKTWTRSHGGQAGMRYSSLDEINKQNVKQLKVAWTYHSQDGGANIQCNPIIVDGVVYLPTAGNHLAAVDAVTGKEIWRYTPELQGRGLEDVPARRGLVYWPGDANNPPRIIFTMGTWMYALDPKTGNPIESFGQHGKTRLPPAGSSVTPAIYKNVIVIAGFATGVFGYDVNTGAQLWTFHTIPMGNEPGAETWKGTDKSGCNDWGGIVMDDSRGIVYIATGQPHPNFIGVRHVGDNLFGNSEIALDATTGKYLWHFQEIRHDVWDLDIPAPPVLVTVTHDGKKVDAVAQVTKMGNTLLLDRVTGRPLFPFRLRRAPELKLPGDPGSPYQPDVELPEPFVRQEFTLADVTKLNTEAHDAVMKTVSAANLGWFVPFEIGKPSIYFGIHGGAEWTGAAADPQGRLYITASELPWIEGVDQAGGGAAQAPLTPVAAAGNQVFQANCAMCHGANREGVGVAPSLLNLSKRLDDAGLRTILKNGRNGMPPQPQLTEDQVKQLSAFLLAQGTEATDGASVPANQLGNYADRGYTRLLDPQQYPGCTPPWGTLTCIDLNTGKIAWKVPLGEYPELKAQGIPKTGTENFGGATVTGGGLVFASGTRDNQIRAFDSDTGEELWKHDLPLHGTAPPAVYEAGGHEYVILPATGGGKLGGPVGDAWISFALPDAR